MGNEPIGPWNPDTTGFAMMTRRATMSGANTWVHGAEMRELETDSEVGDFSDLGFVHCFIFQDPFRFASYMRSLCAT